MGPGSRTHHGDVALSVATQGVPPFKRFNTNVATDRAVRFRPNNPTSPFTRGVPRGVGGSTAHPVLPGFSTVQAGVSESSSSTHHSPIVAAPPSLPPSGFSSNLADLVDLQDAGEPVVWPTGFNRSMAIDFVEDVKFAIGIGSFYKQ